MGLHPMSTLTYLSRIGQIIAAILRLFEPPINLLKTTRIASFHKKSERIVAFKVILNQPNN